MSNYGKCKKCWWWKPSDDECVGMCYMNDDWTLESEYCHDYINREKENKKETLEEWLKSEK
jgi:hypothetical protein